ALLVAPLGLGTAPAVAALALYSVLPVLRNTVVGLREVPSEAVEAARGMGMTETQSLWRVRLPLALPVVVGGIRVAAVTAVGVATVAALVAAGGLGDSIFAGLRADDPTEVLAATLLIAGLALATDGGLALVERLLRRGPGGPGLRKWGRGRSSATRRRRSATAPARRRSTGSAWRCRRGRRACSSARRAAGRRPPSSWSTGWSSRRRAGC